MKCTPSAHTYTKSRSSNRRSAKARCSPCHCVVNRVITDAESPAAEPKNSPRAGAKSPELIPCSYINGNTSDTFGPLRHHGGDHRPEPSVLTGRLVHPAVGHPWGLDLDPPDCGGDRARFAMTVAGREPVTAPVAFVGQAGHVVIDLSLERSRQHLAGTLTNDLIEPDPHLRAGTAVTHHSQHRRFLPHRRVNAGITRFVQRGRYAAPSNG